MDDLQTSRHHIRQSAVPLILRLIGLLFIIETAFVALLAGSAFLPLAATYHFESTSLLWLLDTVKFLLEIAGIITLVVPWATTTYYLSGDELVKLSGLTRLDEKIYDLQSLKSIELHQSWLGRIFNYGLIQLTLSSSGYSEVVKLTDLQDPKKYERAINNQP